MPDETPIEPDDDDRFTTRAMIDHLALEHLMAHYCAGLDPAEARLFLEDFAKSVRGIYTGLAQAPGATPGHRQLSAAAFEVLDATLANVTERVPKLRELQKRRRAAH